MTRPRDEPERLPPPPFWRTRYFAFDVLPRRPRLDPLEIRRIISQPERRMIQPDGRIRLYGYSEGLGCYLRVCYCRMEKPSTMLSRMKPSRHEDPLRQSHR